jgi:hypothetical protein
MSKQKWIHGAAQKIGRARAIAIVILGGRVMASGVVIHPDGRLSGGLRYFDTDGKDFKLKL